MALLADRYELAEPLGSGGMAHVLAATDRRLRRRVAVKLIHDHLMADRNARARLLHEARAAAAFHHPCAVAVFDVGTDGERPFVVMELVEGEPLSDRIAREGRLSAADSIAIGSCVLDALGASHRRGLVHRDVKPGNVLLPHDSGVKLTDFGIAKGLRTTASVLTATGQIIGTPSYLSPEQAVGHQATARSDLYALAVVLYECLTGAPPFTGDSPVAIARAHQHDRVPPLADQAPDTPPALAAVIEQALAKDPAQRYDDAPSMRAALEDAACDVDEPPTITAHPATVPLTRRRDRPRPSADPARVSPRRAVVAAAASALVGLLVVIAALTASDGPSGAARSDGTDTADPVTGAGEAADRTERAGGDDVGDDGEAVTEDEPDELTPITTIGELAGYLAPEPSAAGEEGFALLEEVLELGREDDGADRREDALELAVDVAGWISEDELRADVGRTAILVLERDRRPRRPELAAVSVLFAEAATEASSWGERADDLLDDLVDLLAAEEAADRADEAADLTEALEEWIADDEIDRQRGEDAIAVLGALAAPGDDTPDIDGTPQGRHGPPDHAEQRGRGGANTGRGR